MATHNGRDGPLASANGKLSPPRYALGGRGLGLDLAEDDPEVDDRVEELMR